MINPVLLHIYGPLSIHIYGICIAIGGLITFFIFCKDKKTQNLISENTIITIFQIILISGFFGGRIFEILSQPSQFDDLLYLFRFWEPGLSILGAVITTTLSLTIYLLYKKVSLLKILDRIALYAPLMQSFGRLGCFFAGCCYGLPTTNQFFSISYTNKNHLAPLNCSLHPVQLYSSLLLLFIFLFLYFIVQNKTQKPGLLLFYYLLLISIERFFTDFIRWDRIFINNSSSLSFISIHQWIALGICLISILGIFIISKRNR